MSLLEIQLTDQIWDSLKIAIIIIALLAPVIIALLVFRYKRIIKALKLKQETNQRKVEKRIEIYDRIGPILNDIINFYCYTGNWKEITPPNLIQLKKVLDKEINIATPLFSDDLSIKYSDFIFVCFVSFSGWEHKEKIKSLYEFRQEHSAEWKEDWVQFFDTNNVVDAIMMKERYDELMGFFNEEINI